jgi:LacI family transcriptional regulator
LAGLAVPDVVAILGVDNDELIVNLTSPPLSSIEPDVAATGYLAAQLLDSMMAGHRVDPGLRRIPPLRLATRQSSDTLAVDRPELARGLRYIRDNANRPVSVDEVLSAAGLSRRALDDIFRRCVGRTVHAEIVRARMTCVREMLEQTDLPLSQIAERLGFNHAEYMGVAFKREIGMSPGAYRKRLGSSRS